MGLSSIRAKTISPAVRQFLQQPVGISAIASLGIHALLFAVLPVLPYAALVEDKEPDIRQSVEVVELSAEEQARLPEFPTSQIDLPPLLQDSLPSAVTDLPPLPVPGQSTSPPSADDLFSDPFFTSSLPNFSIPALPPPAPRVQPPRPPQPAPPVQTPQSQPEPEPGLDQPPGRLPGFSIDSGILNPPREESGNARTPEPEADDSVAANSDSSQPETPTESPTVQPRSNEEIIAGLQQDIAVRQRRIAIQQQLVYSATGTAADGNYNPGTAWTAWTANLEEEFGINLENIDRNAKTTIEAPFPPEVCEFVPELNQELVQQGISADYGIVVDPEGQPIGGLSVLRGSGYDFFNNKGGEVVQAETFENNTGKPVPYLVTVVFPYTGDSCTGTPEDAVSQVP